MRVRPLAAGLAAAEALAAGFALTDAAVALPAALLATVLPAAALEAGAVALPPQAASSRHKPASVAKALSFRAKRGIRARATDASLRSA